MKDPMPANPKANETRWAGSGEFDFLSVRDYLLMIRERWFIATLTALAISIGSGYLMLSRPAVYVAQASLALDTQAEQRVVDMHQVDSGLDTTGRMTHVQLANHIQEIESGTFRDYVARSLSPDELAVVITPFISRNGTDPVPSLRSTLGRVEVENLDSSLVLRVNVRHRCPEAAALVANRYVDSYPMFLRERTEGRNERAISFLSEQTDKLRQRVIDAEGAVQEYRRQHNLVSVEENQGAIAQRMGDLNASLTAARVERIDLEARLRQIADYREREGNLLELGDLTSPRFTAEIVNRIGQLRQEREVMAEKYLERHPRMIANAREIEAAEARLLDNIDLATSEMRVRMQNARDREQSLLKELHSAEMESLELDRLKVEYQAMQRSVDGARRAHSQILERLQEATITSQLENSRVRLVDRASVSGTPVEPNLARVGMLVVFLGGFFFVGVPIGLAMLDQRFKNPSDVENVLGQRLLGEISAVKWIRKRKRAHIVQNALDDHVVEAFRGIYSELDMKIADEGHKVFLVTSTVPGEGKSFFVTNLCSCAASHGKRTLMIDFDLRRPNLHRAYGLPNDAGVLRWIEEGASCEEHPFDSVGLGIVAVSENLYLLRAGGRTRKATETLAKSAVRELLSLLREEFDLIVLDTPPLGIFPDALKGARLADKAVYVVRFGKVDRQQVLNFSGKLDEAGDGIGGVVVNGIPRSWRYSHYHSGYGMGRYKYAKYYRDR